MVLNGLLSYVIDIGERIAENLDGPSLIIQGPPRALRIAKNAYYFTINFPLLYICSMTRSYCLKVWSPYAPPPPPHPRPSKYENIYIFFIFWI